MKNRLLALAVAGLALTAAQAQAQTSSRFAGNLSAIIAQPVGEFDDYVDVGWGIGGNFRVNLGSSGIASLRFDGGYINYGRETQRVCLSTTVGCRIQVDLTTTNNIVFGHAGLQVGVPAGPVRPYVNGGIGYSYFFTQSSVEGTDNDDDPFASTTNFDDGTFSWSGGGGLLIPISGGNTPVAIDIGARYLNNNEVDYLTRGAIVDNPDGSIDIFPTRSEAHLITWLIGVTIGFGAR